MLTINNNSRRSFLQIGSLGIGGLTLPNLLRQQAQAADAGQPVKKKSVILVWLAGGPSHLDMYDLKPNAPAEIRGEFRPIPTQADLQPSTNQEFSWRADLTSPAMHSESVMLSEFLLLAVNLFSPSGSALQHSPSCS